MSIMDEILSKVEELDKKPEDTKVDDGKKTESNSQPDDPNKPNSQGEEGKPSDEAIKDKEWYSEEFSGYLKSIGQ